MATLLSKATVGTIGLVCKAVLNLGYCSSVTVNGIENLFEALESEERDKGRGVITIANHISTLDEPLIWGVLPARFYVSPRMRWTLGASDIMFTNPVLSTFFRNGRVLETFRGHGIFQPAIDTAIKNLNEGAWIHLFCEGKVNQPDNKSYGSNSPRLLRFKWGVGRMLMEAVKPPVIIPMWLTGFDKLMPEGRTFPYNFLPRPGVDLSITFGSPVNADEVSATLDTLVREQRMPQVARTTHGGMADPARPQEEKASATIAEHGWLGEAVSHSMNKQIVGKFDASDAALEIARVRSAVTAILHRDVEILGRQVLGDRY